MTAASSEGVGARVARGAAILTAARAAQRIVNLGSVAILARLLAPEDYGVMALAIVTVGLIDVVSNLHLAAAIIREGAAPPHLFDTALTLGLLRGAIAGLALLAAAGPVAAAMDTPALEPVLMVMAILPVLDGLRSPRFVLFEKNLDFSRESVAILASKFGGVAVSVGLAVALRDHWALVGGLVVERAVGVLITWRAAPFRLRLGLRGARDFLSFGGWMTASQIVSYANYKSDTVIVGARLGPDVLGQYGMGDQLASIATSELQASFARAVYPGLAAFRGDGPRLRQAYLSAQSLILALILPVGVGVSLCAAEIVRLALGEGWDLGVPVLATIAPVVAFGMVAAGVDAVVMVEGRTRALFLRNLLNMAFRVPAMIAGLTVFGLPGLLGARVLSSLLLAFTTLAIASRVLGGRVTDSLVAARRSFAACLAMIAAVLAASSALPAAADGVAAAATALVVKAAVGAATHVGVQAALWRIAGRPDGAERRILDLGARAAAAARARLRRAPDGRSSS